MKQVGFFILVVLWAVSCNRPGVRFSAGDPLEGEDSIRYAKGFTVQHCEGYTSVEVRDPWDSTRILQRYLLVSRDSALPSRLPQGTVVRTPVRNVVVYTSVHAAIIDCLGETRRVIGVCEPRYMETPAIQDGLREGRITDLGEATAPNVEKMINIGAEIIIASPFQNAGYGPAEKLGIPIVEAADYMESLPLGRTEWIRFYGLLFGKAAVADSIFRETEGEYMKLKELAKDVSRRPRVFAEKKFGSSWYMPAGNSYIAHLYADAGADYVFKDLAGTGSTPLAFETVLNRAIHADVWMMKYNLTEEMTYKDLRVEYTPYENFDAFKRRNIYTCNTGVVPYFEEFPLHPDYLLKDMVWIFHPELLPADYAPRYYRKMK